MKTISITNIKNVHNMPEVAPAPSKKELLKKGAQELKNASSKHINAQIARSHLKTAYLLLKEAENAFEGKAPQHLKACLLELTDTRSALKAVTDISEHRDDFLVMGKKINKCLDSL
jgi:hypothetical protein